MRKQLKQPDLFFKCRQEGADMEEKVYKTMKGAGSMNIVLGIVSIAAGVAAGVLLIISGAKLIAGKSKILF